MTPILFLDFDGPLFPDRHIPHSRHISEYPHKLHPFINYWEMDATSVRQLNKIYAQYQFDTVVSSTWRDYVERDEVHKLFLHNGLDLHLHKDWRTQRTYDEGNPMGRRASNRAAEIVQWLNEHTQNGLRPSHMILDDPASGGSLDNLNTEKYRVENIFLIDPDVGIDTYTYNHMHHIARCWAQDYTTRYYNCECQDMKF